MPIQCPSKLLLLLCLAHRTAAALASVLPFLLLAVSNILQRKLSHCVSRKLMSIMKEMEDSIPVYVLPSSLFCGKKNLRMCCGCVCKQEGQQHNLFLLWLKKERRRRIFRQRTKGEQWCFKAWKEENNLQGILHCTEQLTSHACRHFLQRDANVGIVVVWGSNCERISLILLLGF